MNLSKLLLALKGGMGSGNWGHSGRLGKRGGSGPGGGLSRLGLSRSSSIVDRKVAADDVRFEKTRKVGGFDEDGRYVPSSATSEAMRRFDAALKSREDDWKEIVTKYSEQEKRQKAASKELNEAMNKSNDVYEKALANHTKELTKLTKLTEEMEKFKEFDLTKAVTDTIYPKKQGNLVTNSDRSFSQYDITVARKKLNSLVTEDITDGRLMRVKKGQGRAFYDMNGNIVISDSSHVATFVHEAGHFIEHKNPKVGKLANQFLENRTEGERLKPLSKVANNPNYRDDELTKPDRFMDAYMGKYYQKGSESYAPTEITSMGLEQMLNNPRDFYKQDREYFGLIADIMNGRIP